MTDLGPDTDPAPSCPACGRPMTEVAAATAPQEHPATDAAALTSTWRCGDSGCPASREDPATAQQVEQRGTQDQSAAGRRAHDDAEGEANLPTGAHDVGA